MVLNQKHFLEALPCFHRIFFFNLMNSVRTMNKEEQCKGYIIFPIEVLLVVAK